MRETTHDRERWTALMDREEREEALSPEEIAFCERFAASDAEAAREQELLAELARIDAVPDAQSRALVDRTLAMLAEQEKQHEQSAVSRMRGTRERAAVVVIGSAALAVAATLAVAVLRPAPAPERAAVLESPPTRVELVYLSGDVRVDGAAPARGATLLGEGTTLAVVDGSACVAMDPAIDVCIGSGSTLRLTRTRSPWRRLDLVAGEVGVQLGPQPDGMRLSVVADDVWTTAIGTAFTVAHEPDEGVRTTVLSGKIELGSDGRAPRIVAAHERAQVRGKEARVTPLTRAEESSEWALLQPAELWREPVSATLELLGAPGAEVVLDGERIGRTPLSTLIPIGRHHVALRAKGRTAIERTFVAQAGRTVAVDVDWAALVAAPTADLPTTPAPEAVRDDELAQAPRPARTPAAALQEARRLMRAGRYADAAAQYEALNRDYPGSPEARTVLVPLAQLELDRLGRPERALVHVERYLQSGKGALAEEARYARVRALAALGQTRQEIVAIEEFLELHVSSLRARHLEERLRELERGR